MTEFGLFMWEVLLHAAVGLGLLIVTIIWMVIAYAVIRLAAEFIKAFKETKNLDLENPEVDQESW